MSAPTRALLQTAAQSTPEVLNAPRPPSSEIRIGRARVGGADVAIAPDDLTRHAAFLGGTGSGKTTTAMFLIEELLLRGVPALLLDRKGDLCRYGAPDAWTGPARSEAHRERRDRLRQAIDVSIFTPGQPRGRNLAMPLAPTDIASVPEVDRNQLLTQSASALAGMFERIDEPSIAVLKQAMVFLVECGQPITLDRLLEVIGSPPLELVSALGQIEPRRFKKLGEHLQTLKVMGGPLVQPAGELLDIGALLGKTASGRTRLSIISTKFLGDNPTILFFVAQVLMALSRWCSRNPKPSLQAVLFADEADLYLPATSKPATKEPMETLFKRARSAGVSVMLATQSPGDLDYRSRDNIRSWFVGLVKEPRALEKMKPMLSEMGNLGLDRIPLQTTGQFHLLSEGKAVSFESDRSAIDTKQLSEDEILELASRR